MTDTRTRLASAFAEVLCINATTITDAATLDEAGLNLDSLDHVEIAMHIEDELRVEIGDDEWVELRTFGDALALVERKLATPEKETVNAY